MSRTRFSPVTEGRYGALRSALDAARLPTDDLTEAGRVFLELSDDAGPIGFIGIEGAGADRLLRSLVVLPGRERKGYGSLLVAHAEAIAKRQGTERLHLLTMSAARFFAARGYRSAGRDDAPECVRATAQFSTLCPGNAHYLVKELV